jgi:hypothetical protein
MYFSAIHLKITFLNLMQNGPHFMPMLAQRVGEGVTPTLSQPRR